MMLSSASNPNLWTFAGIGSGIASPNRCLSSHTSAPSSTQPTSSPKPFPYTVIKNLLPSTSHTPRLFLLNSPTLYYTSNLLPPSTVFLPSDPLLLPLRRSHVFPTFATSYSSSTASIDLQQLPSPDSHLSSGAGVLMHRIIPYIV